MVLHSSPGLGQGHDFDQAQLATLTASVEQKKQQLEADIQAYIKRKQTELRDYEQQVHYSYSPYPRTHLCTYAPRVAMR